MIKKILNTSVFLMLLIAVSSCWGDGKEKEASEQAQSKEQPGTPGVESEIPMKSVTVGNLQRGRHQRQRPYLQGGNQ